MMLRELLGPKRVEVTGGCRKMHNEELNILCFVQILLQCSYQEGGLGRACSIHGKDEKYIKNCSLKQKGRRQRGKHRHICEDNIEMDPKETGYKSVD
jgi:hypothetical protein